jgi:hypothetical protein
MPVILATQEIRRITVRSQPGQTVREILSQKTLHKNKAGGVAQGESLEFKPHYHIVIENYFVVVVLLPTSFVILRIQLRVLLLEPCSLSFCF